MTKTWLKRSWASLYPRLLCCQGHIDPQRGINAVQKGADLGKQKGAFSVHCGPVMFP